MSTKIQTDKNIDLAGKLLKYLTQSKNVPELPQDVSFVPFSNTDKALNLANDELLEKISMDEKPVVKAEEPKNKNDSWIITPVNF
ncbi:MAG: hypothetical protein Q7S27_01690 [Nanoarchaeota archaeon]|nr:hypothetical protein [Nanoarchaeota archaeon]